MKVGRRQQARVTEDVGAGLSYSLKFPAVTEEQFAAMVRSPFHVVSISLREAVERNGSAFTHLVHVIQITPEGKVIELRPQFFCRSEAEAKQMAEEFREEMKTELRERPIAGEDLRFIFVSGIQQITVTGTPLSLLTGAEKEAAIPTDYDVSPPVEPKLIDVGNAIWHGVDGSCHAMKAAITDAARFVEGFRLIKYHEPVVDAGKPFAFGVERVEYDEKREPCRVTERQLCASLNEAEKVFAGKKDEADRIRAERFDDGAASRAEDLKDLAMIRDIEKLAERSDARGRAAHLNRIAGIQARIAERRRAAREKAAEKEIQHQLELRTAEALLDEYFPSVARVAAELKAAAPADKPALKEKMRRAMKVDCERLGVACPYNYFALDGELAADVAKAVKAKSPLKPAQVEAALNWMAKGYNEMREEDWVAEVAKNIKAPLDEAALGKTISKKFGLKSKLKGRPETGSGKSSEG